MQKERSSKKEIYRNWHPDFRLTETLPDVKVVRTGFLVNFIAIMITVILLGMNIYREVRTMSTGGELAALEEKIRAETAQNNRNLKLSSTFAREAKVVEDLDVFYNLVDPPLDFIIAVTENRPENIAFESVSFEIVLVTERTKNFKREDYGSRYVINGVLQGSSAEALIALNNYRSTLTELDAIKDNLHDIEVSQPRRKPDLNLFEFRIDITLKLSKK